MPKLPSHLVMLQLSFTSLPSYLQHLRGRTNLMLDLMQSLPEELDLTSFPTLGEDVRRHRHSFNPLEARYIARQAEFDSMTFVLFLLAADPALSRASAKLFAVIHAVSVGLPRRRRRRFAKPKRMALVELFLKQLNGCSF